MGHHEYLRRYALKIISITWNRDSHGLFDFETRHLPRNYMITHEPANLIREKDICKLISPGVDIKKDFNSRTQLLFEINQKRKTLINFKYI